MSRRRCLPKRPPICVRKVQRRFRCWASKVISRYSNKRAWRRPRSKQYLVPKRCVAAISFILLSIKKAKGKSMNNAALDTFWFRIRMFYPVILITTLILGIWAGGWLVAFEPGFLQGHTTQPLSDVFSSVNALFAGLAFCGLIATIYLQYRDMEGAKKQIQETAEANSRMAQASVKMASHADERAVLDLFQTYCSEYFQGVKDSSMSVLIPCVASKE